MSCDSGLCLGRPGKSGLRLTSVASCGVVRWGVLIITETEENRFVSSSSYGMEKKPMSLTQATSNNVRLIKIVRPIVAPEHSPKGPCLDVCAAPAPGVLGSARTGSERGLHHAPTKAMLAERARAADAPREGTVDSKKKVLPSKSQQHGAAHARPDQTDQTRLTRDRPDRPGTNQRLIRPDRPETDQRGAGSCRSELRIGNSNSVRKTRLDRLPHGSRPVPLHTEQYILP